MSLLSIDIKKIKRLSLKEISVDKPKLIAISQKVIPEENSFSREEIIQRIKDATKVSQERAERGFKLILQVGAIKPTLSNKYYLTGSTPF